MVNLILLVDLNLKRNNNIMDIEYIKCIVNSYRRAEETEEWDEFQEIYGDIDTVCDTLIDIIEKELLKDRR